MRRRARASRSYESVRKQRWGRPEALAAARRYNALARDHGLTPTQMALAFCYTKWQVASTIIGVTSRGAARRGPRRLGHARCRPRCWPRSTRSAGRCATRRRCCRPWPRRTARQRDARHAVLRAHGVAFTEHPYEYLEHGGAQHSRRRCSGSTRSPVVKTLVMQDEKAKPLIVLMHGNRKVSHQEPGARRSAPSRSSPASPRWRSATAATWWAAPRPSARARRCRCTSRRRILALPQHRHQRRPARLPGRHRPAGVRALLGAKPVQCALAE